MSHYKTINALGTPIVVHSGITKMLGSMTASVLLSHIMYWSERTDNPLGFYRELGELKDETSLSDSELRTARKLLVKLGLVSETYKRLEHRLYFKFNAERFDELFGELLNSQSATCEIHNPPPVKSTDGELLNPPFGSSENHNSLYTKITTKNTTKITTKSESKNATPTHTPKNANSDNSNSDNSNPPKPSTPNLDTPKPKPKRQTPFPEDLTPTAKQIAKCQALGFDTDTLFEHFSAHHQAKGSRFVDWSKAFDTWILNQSKFTPSGSLATQSHSHLTHSQGRGKAHDFTQYLNLPTTANGFVSGNIIDAIPADKTALTNGDYQ